MSVLVTVRGAAVLACAAVLALTGCSGSSDQEGAGSSSDDYQPGPLDEYLARIYGYSFDEEEQQSTEDLQAESDRQNRAVEELVASCMADQGFDYVPDDSNGGTVYASDELDVEWGTREFAEQYGYGISTDPWGMDAQVSDGTEEWVDPNADYTAAMSESELAAYQAALWGEPVESVEGDEESTEYDWTTAGCYGAAQHEVYDSTADVVGDYSALEDEISTRWERVAGSSETTELNATWATCMADAGFDGQTTVDDAQQALYDEWNGIQGWNDPDYLAAQESWDWEADPEGPAQPEVDATALADFTAKEIAQAVADIGCQEQVDYTGRSTEIDHASQQEFVDQHRDELEAWAEAASQARGE